jgi:regulator of sigma E protease
MDFSQIPSVILLCLGFGFVIFWHELGHFLAAKWAGVKVEQFAVGFGQALLAWRKGIGLKVGTTQPAYEQKIQNYIEAQRSQSLQVKEKVGGIAETTEREAATALGLGETEYRLNWVPLGGYVKMLGQDDMNPNAESLDPRAYNNQTIAKRMVIVSAGVIMNILLAAFGFMVLFLIGFDAPPAVVGSVLPGSPASQTVRKDDGAVAPLRVGDRILYMDGKYQHDFTKIMLNTALLEEGARIPLYVQRREGTKEHLYIQPARIGGDPRGLLMLGIGQPTSLRGAELPKGDLPLDKMFTAESLAVGPGETVVAVNGKPVEQNQFYLLDEAVQQSDGKPVELTIKDKAGATRTTTIRPHFELPLLGDLQFAGLMPRAAVSEVREDSPVFGRLLPGDVFVSISSPDFQQANPAVPAVKRTLNSAGQSGTAVDIQVLRAGKLVDIKGVTPSVKLPDGKRGLNVGLGVLDELNPVVADVADNSPAKSAGVAPGSTITSIAGQPVQTWFDVQRLLAAAKPDQPVTLTAKTESGEEAKYDLRLTPEQVAAVAGYRYSVDLHLRELSEPRKTSSPLVAAQWGVTETRDFTIQFYLTIKRMVQGSVSYTNMMGPVGIFHAGTRLAYKGTDWLLWFLSMISANLAVVNFLPIPIVDGGLFTFLIIEKLRGKPLSPYAQQVAQFVGLAVLLGVFLLVTYQDITRLF